MVMPNFLIIGAQKSGTTSLYHYLDQHPQVYMSPVKEPKFFALEGEPCYIVHESGKEKKREVLGPGGLARVAGIRDLKSYCKLFQRVSNELAIGEASPLYIYVPKTVERIKHYIPDAKLIAILRHPVDRAYSQFLHWVQRGIEPLDVNFLQVLQEEETRIKNDWSPNYHYENRGLYYIQIKRYFEAFDRNKIRVYLYEELREKPIKLAQDIYRFIGVDDSFVPDISKKYNVSSIPKNKSFDDFVTKPNFIKDLLKPVLPKKIRQQIKDNLKKRNQIQPKLDPKVRKQLIEEYREDILNLQDLLHRDLSKWLE